jgi:hypothetical protein
MRSWYRLSRRIKAPITHCHARSSKIDESTRAQPEVTASWFLIASATEFYGQTQATQTRCTYVCIMNEQAHQSTHGITALSVLETVRFRKFSLLLPNFSLSLTFKFSLQPSCFNISVFSLSLLLFYCIFSSLRRLYNASITSQYNIVRETGNELENVRNEPSMTKFEVL